jgi:hypothetical protein
MVEKPEPYPRKPSWDRAREIGLESGENTCYLILNFYLPFSKAF